MNSEKVILNPNLCPICNKDNRCGNMTCSSKANCWCESAEIKLSNKVLNKIPLAAKDKACICKTCAEANN